MGGAANSALKMVAAHKSFHPSFESVDMLEKIWRKGQERLAQEADTDTGLVENVLACGHELDKSFASGGKYKEAKEVLWAVWKVPQKSVGSEHNARCIQAALTLVSIMPLLPSDAGDGSSSGSGGGGDLDELYEAITEQAKLGGDKELSLRYQHRLGCAQLGRGAFQDAEKTLGSACKAAQDSKLPGLGKNSVFTLQIGWDYGQAILSQPERDDDAAKHFATLWGEGGDTAASKPEGPEADTGAYGRHHNDEPIPHRAAARGRPGT